MTQFEGTAMNPMRHVAKLANCVVTGHGSLPSVPSVATQRYCISALCDAVHGDDVERLMSRELRTPAICVHHIGRNADSSRRLVRVVAVVSCAARARSVLFRLVNRLGLDSDIRLVRWETVGSASPADAQQPFDARVRQSSLAVTGSPERRSAAMK
jgi:hypothetical protein